MAEQAPAFELRIDPLTGAQVQVTRSRQARPNRPTGGCPFCVGGVEAPEPYVVKAFTNYVFKDPRRGRIMFVESQAEPALWD